MPHTGSCHCGGVSYKLHAPIEKALECNCSICVKRAHLLAFVPADQFQLLQGEELLSDYQFGQKRLHHRFCRQCGIATFSHGPCKDGKETYAVNVRTIDNMDINTLPLDFYDGKNA